MSYDNNNTGALFIGKEKTNEKGPDYSGECEVNGEKMRIAGWRRTSKSGLAYLSLKFQKAVERGTASKDADSDLPF